MISKTFEQADASRLINNNKKDGYWHRYSALDK